MEMRGWRWMLLVLLLGGQHLGTPGNRKTRRLVFVTEGRAMSNHDAGNSHKKALKITEALESALKTKRRSAYT
jgi:hypothetical protein